MPSKNSEIAAIFYEIADILEIKNIQWKPRAYRQAAKSLESIRENIEDIYKKGGIKLLEEIPGIGEGIAKKIIQYLETGKINEFEKLKKQIPGSMELLLKIPGMGPKKVKKLNLMLKISTVEQLKKAAEQHKIKNIPGFGEKSEREILEGISLMKLSKERISLADAQKQADNIISQLKKIKEIKKISAAGSLRRKKETVKDIDIIVSSDSPKKIIDAFTKLKEVRKVLAKGPAKASVLLKSGTQSDLRVFAPKSWGSGLFYFTGSKNYNIEMRKLAIKKGCKLSEYGLFGRKTGKMLAGKTEEEICKKLGVRWLKPEQREM